MSHHLNPLRIPIRRLALVGILLPLMAGCNGSNPGAAPGNTSPASNPGVASPGAVSPAGSGDQAAPGAAPTPAVQPTSAEGQPTPEPTMSEAQAKATQIVQAKLPIVLRTIGTPGIDPGQIMLPNDVAVDKDGNVYVSDSKGVQKFDPAGQFVTIVGEGEVKTAQGLAVAPDGSVVYITGSGPEVLVYDNTGKKKSTIGTAGTEAGQLKAPVDVAVDGDGNLYVVDVQNGRLEKFNAAGKHLLTVAPPAGFDSPRAVAIGPNGQIYVGMGDDFLIQQFSPVGKTARAFGHSDASDNLWRIGGLAVDDAGNVYASQAVGHKIQAFKAGDVPVVDWEYGQLGMAPYGINSPIGLAVFGKMLYVADQGNNMVQVFQLK